LSRPPPLARRVDSFSSDALDFRGRAVCDVLQLTPSNLVAGDTNERLDIFVRDLRPGFTGIADGAAISLPITITSATGETVVSVILSGLPDGFGPVRRDLQRWWDDVDVCGCTARQSHPDAADQLQWKLHAICHRDNGGWRFDSDRYSYSDRYSCVRE